ASVELRHDNVLEREGFRYQGWQARITGDAFYSLTNGGLGFARLQGDVRHYKQVFKKIVLASRASAALNSPREIVQHYLGGVPGQLHRPVILQRQDAPAINNQIMDTALHSIHFLNFVTPVRGFRYNTRNGSRFVAANFELRIPVTRMLRRALSSRALYNLEVIPFVDAGTVWVEGNPFSQKKPTDTQYFTEGPLTIKLQTLKSPFLIGFGSGVKTRVLGWTLRMDIAWGVDDYTLQRPMFTTSFARNF
ncbi:MAG: BamA/TamA family outer membrane protein, partial [Bacteroidota bacterium]